MIGTLREGARLPFAKIRRLLETFYGLCLSLGGLVGTIQGAPLPARPAVAAIGDRV